MNAGDYDHAVLISLLGGVLAAVAWVAVVVLAALELIGISLVSALHVPDA